MGYGGNMTKLPPGNYSTPAWVFPVVILILCLFCLGLCYMGNQFIEITR